MKLRIGKAKGSGIAAALCATFALAGAAPAAAADEQQPMSQDQTYMYTCGHLGTPCDDDTSSKPRRRSARKSCAGKGARAHRSRKAGRKSSRACGKKRGKRADRRSRARR